MSMNWLAADPAPRLLVLPPAAVDLGEAEAAIELWEHYSGKTLDSSQRLTVQVMMALGPDLNWAAPTTGREMPRQNGKGDEIEVVELWGLVQRDEAILHTIHDAVLLASQTQQRMLGVLEGHADLRRKVKRKWQGTGQQMIEMRNGGVIWYRTRTGGGGRGIDYVDRLVVDEAQHATEEQLAALSPTMLANPNPQLNAMGSAGIAGISRWWWGVRKRALSADPGAFGYVGHTAENVYLDGNGRIVQEPVDASDRSKWGPANPAVASGRGGGMGFLEEQFRRLPDSFAREHLGVWDDPPVDDEGVLWEVIPRDLWGSRKTRESEQQQAEPGWLTGKVTLSVEMPQDRSASSVCAAGACREGGRGVKVLQHANGVGWVLGAILELDRSSFRGVAIDPAGAAADLIDDLQAEGITVLECKYADIKVADVDLVTGIIAGTPEPVWHQGQPGLTAAVSKAVWRPANNTRVIDRRSGVDVSEFSGCSLALWGHMQPDEAPVTADELMY